jgi:hypothetical protein
MTEGMALGLGWLVFLSLLMMLAWVLLRGRP